MPSTNPCCALVEAPPRWMHELHEKHSVLFATKKWAALRGMYHDAALVLLRCGSALVPAPRLAEIFAAHAEKGVMQMRFTSHHSHMESPLVAHEIGLVAFQDGEKHRTSTRYYTRWVLSVGTNEWKVAFQALSVGSEASGLDATRLCPVHRTYCAGWHGAPPPRWLSSKERVFGEKFNKDETTDLTRSHFHPHAIMVPPDGDEFIKREGIWDYLENALRNHTMRGLKITPTACYVEADNVVHELGIASDTTGAHWRYYVRWVQTDAFHEWRAALDLCWVGDVVREEVAA